MTSIFNIRFLTVLMLFITCCFNSQAQTMYGVSGSNLIRFNATNPSSILQTTPITGMASGQLVAGLDFRPNTGELYAMGYQSATGQARLYKVNTMTGAATAVGASNMTLAQNMGWNGFDFDPSADRIRVVASNGSNYRIDPNMGTVTNTDTNLSYGSGDVNFGTTASMGALAYSNNFIGSAYTKAYAYDNSLNMMTSLTGNGNSGSLTTIGASGFTLNNLDKASDMDIRFDDATQTDKAYFVGKSGNDTGSSLYSMNLLTGQGTLLGKIGTGAGMSVSQVASAMDPPYTGSLVGRRIWGITMNGSLVSFDSDNPDQIMSIKSVTGVTAGQQLMGMDFWASNGKLYAMGYNASNGTAQLYSLNTSTGVATSVGSSINLGLGIHSLGFDFNPVANLIRVTGDNGTNYRISPTTGAIVGTDTNLTYATGDVNQGAVSSIGAVAYSNNFSNATSTTLYGFDQKLNIITSMSSPNNGIMNTVGSSGITSDTTDRSFDMDIFYDQSTQSNIAYFTGNAMGATGDHLYKVDLNTGTMTSVGSVGSAVPLRAIAVEGLQASAGIDLELSISSTTTSYSQYVDVPYTITVRNMGTQVANNVVVSAGLPNTMVHTSNSATVGSYSLYHEEWNVGTLNPGQSATLTLTLFPLGTGNLTNFVQVMSMDGTDGDSTPGNDNNQTADEDDEAMLTINYGGPNTGGGGGGGTNGNSNLSLFAEADEDTYNTYSDVYYHLKVVNNGPDVATNVKVRAGLPQNFVHTSNNTVDGSYSLYDQTWTINSLAVGDTAWLDLTLFPLSNTASVDNFFQIMSANQADANSTPGNGTCCTATEDDEANVNVTWQNNFNGNLPPDFFFALLEGGNTATAIAFPSPTSSMLTLGMVAMEEVSQTYYTIVDHTGRVMETREIGLLRGYNQWTIDVSQFGTGMYFVKLPNDSTPLKFVKS